MLTSNARDLNVVDSVVLSFMEVENISVVFASVSFPAMATRRAGG